jgi:hypothetical protein
MVLAPLPAGLQVTPLGSAVIGVQWGNSPSGMFIQLPLPLPPFPLGLPGTLFPSGLFLI